MESCVFLARMEVNSGAGRVELQLIVGKDRNHLVGAPPSTFKHNNGSTLRLCSYATLACKTKTTPKLQC